MAIFANNDDIFTAVCRNIASFQRKFHPDYSSRQLPWRRTFYETYSIPRDKRQFLTTFANFCHVLSGRISEIIRSRDKRSLNQIVRLRNHFSFIIQKTISGKRCQRCDCNNCPCKYLFCSAETNLNRRIRIAGPNAPSVDLFKFCENPNHLEGTLRIHSNRVYTIARDWIIAVDRMITFCWLFLTEARFSQNMLRKLTLCDELYGRRNTNTTKSVIYIAWQPFTQRSYVGQTQAGLSARVRTHTAAAMTENFRHVSNSRVYDNAYDFHKLMWVEIAHLGDTFFLHDYKDINFMTNTNLGTDLRGVLRDFKEGYDHSKDLGNFMDEVDLNTDVMCQWDAYKRRIHGTLQEDKAFDLTQRYLDVVESVHEPVRITNLKIRTIESNLISLFNPSLNTLGRVKDCPKIKKGNVIRSGTINVNGMQSKLAYKTRDSVTKKFIDERNMILGTIAMRTCKIKRSGPPAGILRSFYVSRRRDQGPANVFRFLNPQFFGNQIDKGWMNPGVTIVNINRALTGFINHEAPETMALQILRGRNNIKHTHSPGWEWRGKDLAEVETYPRSARTKHFCAPS